MWHATVPYFPSFMIMQSDCDLVIYAGYAPFTTYLTSSFGSMKALWHSDTALLGHDCSARLESGYLQIMDHAGTVVWQKGGPYNESVYHDLCPGILLGRGRFFCSKMRVKELGTEFIPNQTRFAPLNLTSDGLPAPGVIAALPGAIGRYDSSLSSKKASSIKLTILPLLRALTYILQMN